MGKRAVVLCTYCYVSESLRAMAQTRPELNLASIDRDNDIPPTHPSIAHRQRFDAHIIQ
jgi:hypothetical protein